MNECGGRGGEQKEERIVLVRRWIALYIQLTLPLSSVSQFTSLLPIHDRPALGHSALRLRKGY